MREPASTSSPRPLPDFLKHGDPALGLGQSKPKAQDPRIAALATEAVLPEHDPSGRNEVAGLEWLRHLLAERIGGPPDGNLGPDFIMLPNGKNWQEPGELEGLAEFEDELEEWNPEEHRWRDLGEA